MMRGCGCWWSNLFVGEVEDACLILFGFGIEMRWLNERQMKGGWSERDDVLDHRRHYLLEKRETFQVREEVIVQR